MNKRDVSRRQPAPGQGRGPSCDNQPARRDPEHRSTEQRAYGERRAVSTVFISRLKTSTATPILRSQARSTAYKLPLVCCSAATTPRKQLGLFSSATIVPEPNCDTWQFGIRDAGTRADSFMEIRSRARPHCKTAITHSDPPSSRLLPGDILSPSSYHRISGLAGSNCDTSEIASNWRGQGLENLSLHPKTGCYVSWFWINFSLARCGRPVTRDLY